MQTRSSERSILSPVGMVTTHLPSAVPSLLGKRGHLLMEKTHF